MLLGFAWESYPLFAFDTFLFFALAALSMMIQIPYANSIDVFSDGAARALFILIGSLCGILTLIYKFCVMPDEEGPET